MEKSHNKIVMFVVALLSISVVNFEVENFDICVEKFEKIEKKQKTVLTWLVICTKKGAGLRIAYSNKKFKLETIIIGHWGGMDGCIRNNSRN